MVWLGFKSRPQKGRRRQIHRAMAVPNIKYFLSYLYIDSMNDFDNIILPAFSDWHISPVKTMLTCLIRSSYSYLQHWTNKKLFLRTLTLKVIIVNFEYYFNGNVKIVVTLQLYWKNVDYSFHFQITSCYLIFLEA